MSEFAFATCQNIVFEFGAASRLAEICAPYQRRSILLVMDPGLFQLGLHKEALLSFEKAGIDYQIYSDVQADPPETVVLEAIKVAKEMQADAVIGFGGGSSMDVAKIVSLLAHPDSTQRLQDIYGVGLAKGKRLPLVQVPTTAGTGSEVTQVAIVTTGETTKAGIVTPLFLPDIAVLDARLTMGLPANVSAATGVDAMVHAIEAYTSKIKKNPLSDMLAREALRLMGAHIHTAVHQGDNQPAREAMLLGSMLAGQAFANAPVAAVHALAYPLGGHFHIPHGLSNALVLTQVMRFNLPMAADAYAELAPLIFPQITFSQNSSEASSQLIHCLEELITSLDLPTCLKDAGVPEDFLPILAKDAMLQTRLLVNNPRPLTEEDALAIYQAAY